MQTQTEAIHWLITLESVKTIVYVAIVKHYVIFQYTVATLPQPMA